MLTSNRNTRGSWHGKGRGDRGCGSKRAVYEAETSDTSKPIVDTTNSEVDIVKLLQAYGMVPTDGSELKHRRMKKIATNEICVIQNLDNGFTFEPKILVLHGSLVGSNIDVQWETCDAVLPISMYITDCVIPIQVGEPLDWSFDMHLIEIDDIHTDVVYNNTELIGTVLKAKQNTGAQINVLPTTVFQTLQEECKLPLYPKTWVKLMGSGNKVINYLGTTKIKCNHNGTESEAIFYVTNIPNTKIILELGLCIDLGFIVVQCDDDCKSLKVHVQVAETSSSTPIENKQGHDDKNSTLPPVPLYTKIIETNAKAHVMQLYQDLFDTVGTIKNAFFHLDVKPGATPIVCSPRRVPDALRNLLKAELDRMEAMKVIQKLDISEASDWVHSLVLVNSLFGTC